MTVDATAFEREPIPLDDVTEGDRVRVTFIYASTHAPEQAIEGDVVEVRASEHPGREVEQCLVDADGTRYRITFGGSISRCDEDREVSVGFFARLDRVREVATDGGHPAKAELEHAVRMLVDEYRGELDDRDLAVVLDAVRMELDHGNYTPARQPRADGGSVAVEMTDEHDRCPECGLVVSGIRTEGPSTHVIEPCGHPADLDVRRAVAERALPDEGVDLDARVVAHLETLYLAADGRLAWTADDRERLAADLVAFRAAFGIEPQTPADAVRFEEEADT